MANIASLLPYGLKVSETEIRERLQLREPNKGEETLSFNSQAQNQHPNRHNSLQLNTQQDRVDQLLDSIPEAEYQALSDDLLSEVIAAGQKSPITQNLKLH